MTLARLPPKAVYQSPTHATPIGESTKQSIYPTANLSALPTTTKSRLSLPPPHSPHTLRRPPHPHLRHRPGPRRPHCPRRYGHSLRRHRPGNRLHPEHLPVPAVPYHRVHGRRPRGQSRGAGWQESDYEQGGVGEDDGLGPERIVDCQGAVGGRREKCGRAQEGVRGLTRRLRGWRRSLGVRWRARWLTTWSMSGIWIRRGTHFRGSMV